MINGGLVRDLKRLGLWDDVMIMDLKHFKGSLHPIDRVPQDIKALYSTAFEVDPQWLVEAASRRQKWIDQAQSLNIYMAGASGKRLDDTYKLAWVRGLKTTHRHLRGPSPAHSKPRQPPPHHPGPHCRPRTSSSARSTIPAAKPVSNNGNGNASALSDALRMCCEATKPCCTTLQCFSFCSTAFIIRTLENLC